MARNCKDAVAPKVQVKATTVPKEEDPIPSWFKAWVSSKEGKGF